MQTASKKLSHNNSFDKSYDVLRCRQRAASASAGDVVEIVVIVVG